MALGVLGNLVEELMQRDEVRALHIPVGLLGLHRQVDGVDEPGVQQFDDLLARLGGDVVAGLVHGGFLRRG